MDLKKTKEKNYEMPLNMFIEGDLPPDVMVNILLKLPGKSLVCFKSVCKSWYALIDSISFTQMHVLQHLPTNTEKLLRFGLHSTEMIPTISLLQSSSNDVEDGKDTTQHSEAFSVSIPFKVSHFDKVVIEDSCNGLVSLKINSKPSIVLWNPATKKSRLLKLPLNDHCSSVGIAFILDTKDYRIVRIPRLQKQSSSSNSKSTTVWIYSLNSDSWKKLDVVYLYAPLQPGPPTLLNGFMHWTTDGLNSLEIAAFDVNNENFQYLTLPESMRFIKLFARKLVTVRESLGIVVAYVNEQREFSYEVWVMNEYGVESSWRKQFIVEPFPMIASPVGSWKDGKLLFTYFNGNNEELLSYDPFNSMIERFPPSKCINLEVVNYVESLESVEGGSKRNHQERNSIKDDGETSTRDNAIMQTARNATRKRNIL